MVVVERIGLLTQRPVIDETNTAKRASKDLFWLVSWIKPVLVGVFLFHALHCSMECVEHQQEERRHSSPKLKARGPLTPNGCRECNESLSSVIFR